MLPPSCHNITSQCLDDFNSFASAPVCVASPSRDLVKCFGLAKEESVECLMSVLGNQNKCTHDLFTHATNKVSDECADHLEDRFQSKFSWILLIIFITMIVLAVMVWMIYKNTKKVSSNIYDMGSRTSVYR